MPYHLNPFKIVGSRYVFYAIACFATSFLAFVMSLIIEIIVPKHVTDAVIWDNRDHFCCMFCFWHYLTSGYVRFFTKRPDVYFHHYPSSYGNPTADPVRETTGFLDEPKQSFIVSCRRCCSCLFICDFIFLFSIALSLSLNQTVFSERSDLHRERGIFMSFNFLCG